MGVSFNKPRHQYLVSKIISQRIGCPLLHILEAASAKNAAVAYSNMRCMRPGCVHCNDITRRKNICFSHLRYSFGRGPARPADLDWSGEQAGFEQAGFEQASAVGNGVINAGKAQTMPGKRMVG